jgi:hypothetical protein
MARGSTSPTARENFCNGISRARSEWGLMVHFCVKPSISTPQAAERIDQLLELVALEYRALPRCHKLFREALSRHALPGGYSRAGAVARPLSESLKGEMQSC